MFPKMKKMKKMKKMNKFQKLAYQISKDDSKKEIYKNQNIIKRSRICYSIWNSQREQWPFEKCLSYKNWAKGQSF